MASHIVGYPRMGPKRELKFALESFWDGKSSAEDLQKVAADLRSSIWKQMAGAGIKYIPSNTFSYYDQMLDTTAMLGAVPERYGWNGGEIAFDTFFSMARGNASVPAMEMTKWFDTNYHYIVPELGPNTKFAYSSHKAVTEYKEAKALGVDTVPVLIGPVTYLLFSKPAKGVEKSFSPLSLLTSILPVYKEVIAELKAAGASWIQIDEPTLVLDLEAHQLESFTKAYSELESSFSGLNVLVETYFADIPAEAYKTLTSLNGVSGFSLDLVRGTKTLDLVKSSFPSGKYLFAGVVDGRNIWANDLAASLSTLEALETTVGKDKLVVSTSCSLMHTAVDLVNETKLDDEIKSWLAFAAQKVLEVNALAKALAGSKDEAFFAANAAAQASRKSSPRVTNEEVQKAATALRGSDHRRATNVSSRLDAQQKKLNLSVLPTTTIGSFPETAQGQRDTRNRRTPPPPRAPWQLLEREQELDEPEGHAILHCVHGVSMGGESNTSHNAFIRDVSAVQGPLPPQIQQLPISFSEEDLVGVRLPHCDALVINLGMANFDVRKILVDNGSSVNVLFLGTFENLKLSRDKLKPAGYTLHGFSGVPVTIEGIITLDVTAGTFPNRRTETMDFMVVNVKSAYNAILGRPGLCSLQAVPSAYHQKMKFPTSTGVGIVCGNQEAARSCYITAIGNGVLPLDTVKIRPQRTQSEPEPADELENVSFETGDLSKHFQVRCSLAPHLKTALISCIRPNVDLFA